MASRSKTTEVLNPVDVFVALQTFEPTEDDAVSVVDLADDQKWDHKATFAALEILADAELVDAEGRGLTSEWWITVPDVTAENSESVVTEALVNFQPSEPVKATKAPKPTAKQVEARERLEYATRAAESQDGLMSQAPEYVNPLVVFAEPAETPVIAEDGQKVTIPVDFDDPSKGRRELDASKGEKLLSEDVFTVKDKLDTTSFSLSVDAPTVVAAVAASIEKLKTLPDKGLDQFVDAETGDMMYESAIEKNGLKLDEPAEVPPCPAGVNANVWDLANTAITQTARDYWLKAAAADALEYEMNKGASAPF